MLFQYFFTLKTTQILFFIEKYYSSPKIIDHMITYITYDYINYIWLHKLHKLQIDYSSPKITYRWMVKSKLPPRSGCSLEAVEPHP